MEQKIKDRSELALENFKGGMNCSQSVVMAYSNLLGADSKTIFRATEGFGLGMGGMRSVCGAVTGLFMLLGLKNSSGNTKINTKAETLKLVKEAADKFKNINGSIICAELKGQTGLKTVPCTKCIEDACKIFEEYTF